MRTPERVRLPRRIRAGARPAIARGAVLSCLVVHADSDEWVGVDLSSGTLLRSARGRAQVLGRALGPDGEQRRVARFDVVAVTVADDSSEPPDPARPEAVAVTETPMFVGRPRSGAARRLLRALATPERKGASLLSSWGPSVAHVVLDGSSQSVVVVATSAKSLALELGPDGTPLARVTWSGVTQAVPVADPACRRALSSTTTVLSKGALVEALGFRPAYLVCALAAVEEGHARKVVLAVLSNRPPRRRRRLPRQRAGGEVLRHRPAEGDEGIAP